MPFSTWRKKLSTILPTKSTILPMSQTPQQQRLTYPVPLQIEWKNEPFPDETSGALIVRDPNTLLAKLGLQGTWNSPDGSLPTYEQFCRWMQELMVREVNQQLRTLEPLLFSLTEKLAASEKAHEEGLRWLHREVNALREQLVALSRQTRRDGLGAHRNQGHRATEPQAGHRAPHHPGHLHQGLCTIGCPSRPIDRSKAALRKVAETTLLHPRRTQVQIRHPKPTRELHP
jgi:hypothetical protein